MLSWANLARTQLWGPEEYLAAVWATMKRTPRWSPETAQGRCPGIHRTHFHTRPKVNVAPHIPVISTGMQTLFYLASYFYYKLRYIKVAKYSISSNSSNHNILMININNYHLLSAFHMADGRFSQCFRCPPSARNDQCFHMPCMFHFSSLLINSLPP